MLRNSRTLLAGVLAALAIACASASADELSISPSGSFSAASTGPVTFEAEGLSVECDVTLSGSFHSGTIDATPGESLGVVTRSALSGCFGVTLLGPTAESPWEIEYASTTGIWWDAITTASAELVGVSAAIGRCLYRGDATITAPLTNVLELTATYSFDAVRFTSQLSKVSGEESCPATADGIGTFAFEAQRTAQVLGGITWISGGPIVDFGTQAIRDRAQWYPAQLSFRNSNHEVLTVRSVFWEGGSPALFREDVDEIHTNTVILRNGTHIFTVSFNPQSTATVSSTMVIELTNGRRISFLARGRGS